MGVNEGVTLEWQVTNRLKYFAHADIVVLSLLLEVMPDVLIEGMVAGFTPVATDCPTDPRKRTIWLFGASSGSPNTGRRERGRYSNSFRTSSGRNKQTFLRRRRFGGAF